MNSTVEALKGTKPVVRERMLIVDDSSDYREKEASTREFLGAEIEANFYYTDYENRLIRWFHGTPVVGNFLSHMVFWGVSIHAALMIFFFYRRYQCKLFVNPIVGFFYCFLARLGRRREVIGLAGFLFVHKKSAAYLRFRKWFVTFSCKSATLIFVYSRSEVSEYSQMFPELASKFRFVLYGRDFGVFGTREFQSSGTYIASGGITNRDFRTLVSALWILNEEKHPVPCKIATRAGYLGNEAVPPGLEILGDVRIDQFGDFMQKASLIVLPLKRTQVSGGHMVLLEAMSRGKLVIVADTPGVRDYVAHGSAILYEAENPEDLARALRLAHEKRNEDEIESIARRGQTMYQSTYAHVHLLARLVKELMSAPVPLPE